MVALRACGFDAHGPAGVAGAKQARAAGELVLGLAAPTGGICHGGGGESTRRVRAYPVRGADQRLRRVGSGPAMRVTPIHPIEVARTSAPCRLSPDNWRHSDL